MSDFNILNQNENQPQDASQYRKTIQNNQQEDIEAFKQKKEERLANWNRYGVEVPDEYYKVFNQIISKAPTPEEAQEEAYKIGSAIKYSRMMNIPIEEAYKNVDSFNEAMFTDMQGQKGRYEALSDMWNLGTNNVKLGRLGHELMQAHRNNDTELVNTLMAEIDAINQQNVLMQDNAPRTWVMEALEAGAQSLPFTGVVAGAGIIGNFIAPAAGTAASFMASSYLASGQEYIDMIANGASPETAQLVATVSGGIQGLIEADLGITKGIVKGGARLIGKQAAEKMAKEGLEEIGRKVFKRFHFGTGKKLLVNYLEQYGKNILGEGTEEFLQEITSIVGQEVAASLDGYDIPDDDFKSIVKQTTEAFRGGILGALSMGFIPAGINGAADIKEYKLIKDTAELFESEEMFKNAAKDSPVFEGMSDAAKEETIHEVWQRAQDRKDVEAQQIAEGRDAAEGAEEAPAENEDGTTEANPVARDEAGRLYTSDDVSTDEAGNVTGGTFVIGDKTKSENNRYGYIKYSQDAEGNITIDTFKMTEGRDKLRAEAFDEFAREHPDANIEWNATAPDLQDFKNELIESNPSGKKNGLNYYSTTDLDDIAARKMVADELRKNIHNVKDLGNGKFEKTDLNNKQIAAGITLIESAARRMNMGLAEYINKTFGNQIFGTSEEFTSASLAQGENVKKKAGGMKQGVAQANWREVGQQIKAVIYAGEHADFSTWAHEMAHVFQNQLDGQLKTDAENAFNVKGGDWYNSYYTFKDGRKMRSAEAFAWGFQDWLETGKAENEQMRNIFQKFAEFIADCYNRLKSHLDFTPEIESVFNQLLDGDDTIMSKALKAAQEQDNEYRALLKRKAEEKKAAQETERKQAAEQAKAEREEASEGTDFTEEKSAEEKLADAENKISEATNETKETDNAIDNALENTNLTDEQKEEIAETLKDEGSTVVEKAEATTEAAESAYDDEAPYDLFQDEGALLSQLIAEPAIQKMTDSNLQKQILNKLKLAVLFEKNGDTALQIRYATGWEKDGAGEWKYETDDSLNKIKNLEAIYKAAQTGESLKIKDVLDAEKLYEIIPSIKEENIRFSKAPSNQNVDIDKDGIIVFTKTLTGIEGEDGLKGAIAEAIQYYIQAYEYAKNSDEFNNNVAAIHNKRNELVTSMQKAIENQKLTVNYDAVSLRNQINNIKKDRRIIEARNVARRVMYDAITRKDTRIAKTEDKQELLSQEENPDFLEATKKAQELLRKNKLRRVLFQDEINTIRKQYENTDQWMKAPNGAKTKLNEKQWLQVRTPSFKKWFGDWEKDPQNASKVVDTNGEPLVVYHGSNKWFQVFNEGKTNKSNVNTPDNTIFTNDSKKIASSFENYYGGNIKDVILDKDSPLHRKYDWGTYRAGGVYSLFMNLRNPKIVDYKGQTWKADGMNINDEVAKAMQEGYDGFIAKNIIDVGFTDVTPPASNDYIAFNNTAVKSATDNNGNFDANNPNILFQDEYDPRSLVPNVRGGWTEKKIIKYLKDNPTLSGVVNAIRFIKEFDTPEELKAHMFYHGTALGSDKLKPSITMSDRDIERYGGGGYGQKYWSISVSKSKKVASNFAPMSDGVRIYPIILAKNAKVIEMPELTDSVELEDHIIDLWNQGVDAVWIGDKDSGEQELSILNPRAVVNIGRADWYKNYALGTEKNPINIKDDEQIKEMFDYAKNYERKTELDFGKPSKPLMPISPFMYLFDDNSKIVKDENGDAVKNPNYNAEYAEYEKQMEDYKKQKEEYEQAVNDWYSSDDYKEWEKFDRERRNVIFFQDETEEDIQRQVNELMTMEKAADMIQRTFVLANIKDWYDGEYANGDEWLKDRGVDEVAMYVDNEWQIQEKFLNNIPALMDGDFTSADIIEAYLNGTLTGPQQKKEALKPINRSVDTGFTDERFYAPRRIDTDAKELLEKASVKVTDANRKEVYKARADFITAAHEPGFAASIGMTQAAVNKKIMSWAAYPANAAKISNNINKDASLQNKWTGIVNSNLLKLFSIDKEQLMSMVKDVTGNPSEYQLTYVTSVILALDTHIDFSGLTYEFNAHIEKDTVAGQYNASERRIQIKRDSLNTIAHETGHALDHLWGREILGGDAYLTERVRIKANSDTITDPNVKSFLQHFADFLESIENVSDLRSGYTMDSKEVFARFVARFTEWTRNVATNNRFGFERDWYNDKFTTQQYYEFAKILQEKSALDTTKQKLLSQEVYHGSGADFDKFDTEQYGLSGEGSMSFGYGTYVTDSEDIARDYAERQRPKGVEGWTYKGKLIKSYENAFDLKEVRSFLMRNDDSVEKAIEEIEQLKRMYEYGKKDVAYTARIEDFKKYLAILKDKDFNVNDFVKYDKTNLYTVEIPDDGYFTWNENIDKKSLQGIKQALNDKGITDQKRLDDLIGYAEQWKDNQNASYVFGSNIYKVLTDYLGGQKQASQFLSDLGYAGIKYPAGTIHGNGNGAYNYVIFNDDDAKIVSKLLFQTNAELMDEARTFDSWQEFMDYCEAVHTDDEVSPIPGDADAQWYQTFYETANGVQVEQEKNEEAVKAKNKREGMLPTAVDAYFTTMIRSDPQMLDSFLQAVAEIDAIDLDSDEWQQAADAEDAAQRDKIDQLKDFIGITLSDYNWQTALKRIQGGHEISEGLRKRLIGEITDNFKARDFRALYAEVMNDPQFAVAEEDSITASLNKKLKKYHDIVKPTDDITRWSPERRKQLAEQLANREIAAKIRSGSLKLDDELDAYIKSLNKQIKETQEQYNELEKETKADYQRIADKERRDLLKLHEQLLLARGKLKSRNTEVNRKIAKGLKITDKYSRMTQNLNANYDEIFRKYNDLRNSITINAEVQAALERQEQFAGLKEDLNAKQKEKNLTAEIKKMRIQLVKKTMRRVPFNRIDYNNARTVIAIQRMLEPNLLGGVNRFIGIDSPYLRGVISQIVTDSDYKEKILNYLSKNAKASQAFADFKKKLTELKTIKDFDSWTAKDRKAAIRYLPKENWVRDLNLKELAKEREESIDLDIGMEEIKRTVYDEKTGEPKTYKDKDGNEHNVTETAFKLKANEEIERLVQDAVGADMFNKIVNMPFSEWTTEDLETLAQRIDEIYTEGRDLKAAKDEARKREAAAIRKRIEDAIKETGITINDDDTPEEKERKQKQIDKILGMSNDLKGTEAGKTKGLKARLNRLLHSYADMNVLRFARMLDGQSEGENVRLLYRKEDDCYNAKQRSMNSRAEKIYKVMKDNNITEGDLAEVVKVSSLGTEFTVDELLYFLAADKDYAEDEKKLQKGLVGLDANDDFAATSRNAVMFGNMMSDMMSQEEKESWLQLDKDMEEALQNDALSQEQKEQLATGQLDKKPGTTRYIMACHAKWEVVLGAANNFLSTYPEYKALMEAIEADYAEQYGRMNEVSINEFNMPVHRVKAYVPLVRRESNGDTNENQVKEDLLGAAGVGKQWADRGMTQRRVQISPLNQKPVQTGLFRTWGDSIERTEHFIAYAPYVRQLNAIYKSRDASYTRRYIESRYGAGAIKYLDEYINEVANPNAGRIRERGAEWLHVLRGKTAPAYLGWKASAIIKQGLTSPWPYMQFVNPAEYVSAAMKFTFNPQMREAIKEKSVFMKMRRMDPVNDLIDEMADNAKSKLDRGWSNFSKLGMQGLELIDWACVAPGWLACYEKKYNQLQNASNARYESKMAELKERNMYADVGTSEYLTPEQMEAEAKKEILEDIEAEAVRYADDCTRACQPSNRVTDLAPMFKNSSEAMKAFLQFQTSLNVIWQNLRYDMPYAVKNKEFTRIAGTVIGYVCAGIFMNSVMEGIGGDDDDDETQALRNLIYYSTTQFTDSIPIMGSEITNTMDQLITGKRGFYGSGTDMTPSATKLLSVLTTAKKGNWQKAAELTAEGIGLYLGAPVSGTKEINKLLGKPLSEGDVNLKRGISDVYGIAGDIIGE